MSILCSYSLQAEADRYQAVLTLEPTESITAPYDQLCFSTLYPVDGATVVGGELVEVVGDWNRFKLDEPFDGTRAMVISYAGQGQMTKATDYPYGVYLQSGQVTEVVDLPRPIVRPLESPKAENSQFAHFLPRPQQLQHGAMLAWSGELSFNGELWNRSWLERLFKRLGLEFTQGAVGSWAVVAQQDSALESAFTLEIAAEGAHLRYRDIAGFYSGQAYLFQFLLQWAEAGELASCALQGTPEYDYRGAHLDVVRHFFEVQSIAQWLDILALFQFNHFHWHLTDDEGWRVESQRYPELSQIAAWRGPGEKLTPQMGSGARRYGGFYCAAEVKALVKQAESLGITVVPELDIPGHARALLTALPQLIESEDESQYRSIQRYTDNVINPCYGETLTILKTLLDEWCELFPGDLVHVGADEVPKGVWTKSPSAQRWLAKAERAATLMNAEKLVIGHLMAELQAHLEAKGRTLAGWEEVTDGGGVSTAAWVYSWQGVEAGQKAARAGHSVVMTPAQSCYLDLAINADFHEPGYVWAGTLDIEALYQYQPKSGLSEADAEKIRGVQYCLWSELLESDADVEFMWFPRLLAGSQVVWGGNTNLAYKELEPSIMDWNKRLARMGLGVRALK